MYYIRLSSGQREGVGSVSATIKAHKIKLNKMQTLGKMKTCLQIERDLSGAFQTVSRHVI